MKNISRYVFNKYYKAGWLTKQVHPKLPLIIWNYTAKTQYEQFWNETTLMCRGLVTDLDGNIVARPFSKFFNLEENKHTPTKEFDVYEKMDGSLGILFSWKGEWIFATRGSFISDQSVKGREMLKNYDLDLLSPGYTYLFEIIYDENRIVVDYDYEDLVMLACIETESGNEADIHNYYYQSNFNVVKKYSDIDDYSTLKQMVHDNAEGFVIQFSSGERIKVKGEEYVRLHKIITQVSTKSVWEILSSGQLVSDYIEDVPDEYYDEIRSFENELVRDYNFIDETAKELYKSMYREGDTAKDFALRINDVPLPYKPLLFALFNDKLSSYDKIIWKEIKPTFKKIAHRKSQS